MVLRRWMRMQRSHFFKCDCGGSCIDIRSVCVGGGRYFLIYSVHFKHTVIAVSIINF